MCGCQHSPGGQPEQVVHGVGVVPQAVLLLQQLEGRHAQSLEKDRSSVSGQGGGEGGDRKLAWLPTFSMSSSPCLQPSSIPYSSTRMLPRYRKQEWGYTWYTLTI